MYETFNPSLGPEIEGELPYFGTEFDASLPEDHAEQAVDAAAPEIFPEDVHAIALEQGNTDRVSLLQIQAKHFATAVEIRPVEESPQDEEVAEVIDLRQRSLSRVAISHLFVDDIAA